MSDESKKIECDLHGESASTFLCRHLLEGEMLGFNPGFDPDDPNDLYPDAWCDACDEVLDKEGEWTDKALAFSDIKVICAQCYCDIREKNWVQDEDNFERLIVDSFAYLQEVQAKFMETYKVDVHERWDWHQETGKLIFSHEDKVVVECDIDFVGTFSSISDTWMWAWANESFTENIVVQSKKIRALGEEQNFRQLSSALWPATPEDGWEMSAIMAKKLNAIGAYRTPDEDGFVYMVVRRATWV